jgi:hypothetical protein
MNEALTARMAGIRKILMAHHEAGQLMPSASKGTEREALVREFLAKVFPAPYRFGSGGVTDAAGAVSGQLDIVVEFPFFASFPTPSGAQRLYFAESVAFVIEVKSDVAAQWSQVEKTAAAVRPLRRQWLGHIDIDASGKQTTYGPSLSRIPFVAVGYRGYSSVETLRSKMLGTPEDRRPDGVLVIESGAYVGWQLQALGEEGLFAFAADGSYFARNVIMASPHFKAYLAST